MSLRTHQCTECEYAVEAGWQDRSRYLYKREDVTVVCEPVTPASSLSEVMAKTLERFRLGSPGYQLAEDTVTNQPLPGARHIVHRFGGAEPQIELAVAWAQNDTAWVLRVHGPPSAEDECRRVMQSFLSTFEPVENP